MLGAKWDEVVVGIRNSTIELQSGQIGAWAGAQFGQRTVIGWEESKWDADEGHAGSRSEFGKCIGKD